MGTAFIGKAKVRIGLYSAGSTFKSRPLRYLENTSRFELGFTEEEKKLADFTNATGGVDASSKRISDITGSMDARHFTAENLALALWGSTSALGATPIVAETGFKIVPNMFLATDRLIDVSVAPVLKKGATTILAADYTYSPGGVLISSTITTGTVVSGDAVTIDYTPKASSDVQALISAAPDVSLLLEGINEIDSKYTTIKIWKAKLGVAQGLGFITEDFGTLTMSVTIQKDETVSAAGGKSQYFMLETQT
jgi:hypothetical protein